MRAGEDTGRAALAAAMLLVRAVAAAALAAAIAAFCDSSPAMFHAHASESSRLARRGDKDHDALDPPELGCRFTCTPEYEPLREGVLGAVAAAAAAEPDSRLDPISGIESATDGVRTATPPFVPSRLTLVTTPPAAAATFCPRTGDRLVSAVSVGRGGGCPAAAATEKLCAGDSGGGDESIQEPLRRILGKRKGGRGGNWSTAQSRGVKRGASQRAAKATHRASDTTDAGCAGMGGAHEVQLQPTIRSLADLTAASRQALRLTSRFCAPSG